MIRYKIQIGIEAKSFSNRAACVFRCDFIGLILPLCRSLQKKMLKNTMHS